VGPPSSACEASKGTYVRRHLHRYWDTTVAAAQLLVSWSHHGRVRSEAAFAMLAGVAPLQASSGTVVRHRLNRSGDRALNRVLHLAVLSRMAHDPETKAYVARRLAEGKTRPEIRRCVKRHLARRLYRAMQASPTRLDGHRSVRLVKGHRALCPFARTIGLVSLTIARWLLRESSYTVAALLPTPLDGTLLRSEVCQRSASRPRPVNWCKSAAAWFSWLTARRSRLAVVAPPCGSWSGWP